MSWEKFGNYFSDRPPAWLQPSLKLEWMLTTANAANPNLSQMWAVKILVTFYDIHGRKVEVTYMSDSFVINFV
jgi:hypothetical protein